MSNLQDVLQQIDSLLKELNSLPAIAEKDEIRLWQKFRLEWNYNSNHIEGNTLTYGETMLLLIKGKTTGDHDIREYDEMKAHDVAVDVVKNWAISEVRPFNSGDICDLNRTLLVRPFWKDAITPTGDPTQKKIIPGQYKTTPNHVKLPNGEVFRYTEPEDVQREMQELIDWYRDEAADLHPLITAAMLHYRFVCIHPFDDGNGRVSRLLMNYHLMKNDIPPIIIKSDDKKNYLTALSKADAGDEESFITYVGEQLLWSLELAIRARKGDSIEEEEDWKKRVALIKKRNSDEIIIKRNNEVILERFFDSFVPLFNLLTEELGNEFDEMFDSFERTIYTERTEISEKMNNRDFVKHILSESHTNNIRTHFMWEGFLLDGTNTFYHNDELNIRLTDYHYSICSSHNDKIIKDKLYSQRLTKEELRKIVNFIGMRISSSIENKIKHK